MWYDRWSSNIPIGDFVTLRDLYDTRLSKEAVVADMINNNEWKWPSSLVEKHPEMINIAVPTIHENRVDKVF